MSEEFSVSKIASKLALGHVDKFVTRLSFRHAYRSALKLFLQNYIEEKYYPQFYHSIPIQRFCKSVSCSTLPQQSVNDLIVALAMQCQTSRIPFDSRELIDKGRTLYSDYFIKLEDSNRTRTYLEKRCGISPAKESQKRITVDDNIKEIISSRKLNHSKYFTSFSCTGSNTVRVHFANERGYVPFTSGDPTYYVDVTGINPNSIDFGFFMVGFEYYLHEKEAYLHTVFADKHYRKEYPNFGSYIERPHAKNLLWCA